MTLAQRLKQALRPMTIALSALLALWVYLGLAITRTGSAFSYLQDSRHALLSLVLLLGCWLLLFLLVTALFWLLDLLGSSGAQRGETSWTVSLVVFSAILACWLPYLIISFPGFINFDYFNQLNQFVGARPLNNHHPIAMTFLLGWLYEAGHLLGGASGGLHLTVCVQALCLDGLFCYLHRWLCRMGVRRSIRVAVVTFCALCPIFPLYACVLVKDTLSATVLGLFAVLVAGRIWCERNGREVPRLATMTAIALVGFAASLTRANCVYLVVGTLVVCLFWLRGRSKLGAVAALLAITTLYACWTNVLLPILNVIPSDTALVISIPLQQTGAFARDAADEATQDERDAIEALLATSYDEVGSLYTPNSVDPLQGAAKNQADDKDTLTAYLAAWASQGLRRPDIYLDALLRANVGYWYPGIAFDQLQDVDYTQNTPASHVGVMRSLGYAFSGDLADIDTAIAPFGEGRAFLQRQLIRLSGIPIAGLLLQPAFYSWACLLIGSWAALQRKDTVPLFALAVLLFLVECVSPLAASMRYALPLVVLTPVMAGASLAPRQNARPGKESQGRALS